MRRLAVFLLVKLAFVVAHHNANLSTVIDCGELKTTLCLDEIVHLDCNIAHSFLEWEVPSIANCTNSRELDFIARDKIGQIKTCESFTATLVSTTGPSGEQSLSSSLIFTVQPGYNNTNITCFDAQYGDAQTCTITIAGRPSRPLNVTAHKYNKTTMQINWNHPVVSGGVPISYDVTVSPPPHDGICSDGNCNVNDTELFLSGLECLRYNITLQARNCVGQGCLFNLSTASELPGRVVNLVDTGRIIQWSPHVQIKNTGEEKILYYTVSIAFSGLSWNVTQTSFNYGQFLNLSDGEFSISIQAVNCHGEGDPVGIAVNLQYSTIQSFIILVSTFSSFYIIILLTLFVCFVFLFKCTTKKSATYHPSINSKKDEI